MTQTQSTMRNNSVSSSALITTRNEFLNLDSNKQDLTAQLDKNTSDLVVLLKTRHELLTKMSTTDSKKEFSSTESSNSKSLINNSLDLLNQLTTNLITNDLNSQQAKSLEIIIKIEECLNEIKRDESTVNLPDLKHDSNISCLSFISNNSAQTNDSFEEEISTENFVNCFYISEIFTEIFVNISVNFSNLRNFQ